ncbi:hypothetical protein [Desulfobacula sp.]|uniref:hypothetical protein n=1 Tax=Desulfobacula sp. TaxID=2593537 RepID=UPI0025BDE540|nr:hypothetical protein [Desulfobacula sp.]MBC2705061.1 hypothetical protein [Desulfobacula sp.]
MHEEKIYICSPENRLVIKPVKVEFQVENLAVLSTGLEQGETLVLTDLVPAVEGMLLKPFQDSDIAEQLKRQATGEAL